MVNHSKVMLLGLLPAIALLTLLGCGTVQQKSALAFGAEDKNGHFYVVDKNAHFYDVFITTENGVKKFAADYRKITGDGPSDTVIVKNTLPRTAPNVVLKEGKSTEIHFDCKNDDCLTNTFDRFDAKLVPLETSDKTIVTGKPHIVKTIVDNHPCSGTDEACSFTFDFPSKDLKPGQYLLVIMASIDEFTGIFINEVKVIKTQSYADGDNNNHKKGKDFVSPIIASSESDKKSANQDMDQDNFCYSRDDCEQANQGQQIVGKDNEAKGFNDQSENPALSALGAGTGNATGNGNWTTPTPRTCEECFTFILTSAQITAINTAAAGSDQIAIVRNQPTVSALIESLPIALLTQEGAGIDLNTANALVTCLKAHGEVFVP